MYKIKDINELKKICKNFKNTQNYAENELTSFYNYCQKEFESIKNNGKEAILNISNSKLLTIIIGFFVGFDLDFVDDFDFKEMVLDIENIQEIIDSWTNEQIFNELLPLTKSLYSPKNNLVDELEKTYFENDLIINLGLANLSNYPFEKYIICFARVMQYKYAMLEYKRITTIGSTEPIFKENKILKELDKKSQQEIALKDLESVTQINEIVEKIIENIDVFIEYNYKMQIQDDNTIKAHKFIYNLIESKEINKLTSFSTLKQYEKDLDISVLNFLLDLINNNITNNYKKISNENKKMEEKIEKNGIDELLLSLKIKLKQIPKERKDNLSKLSNIDFIKNAANLFISLGINPVDVFNQDYYYVLLFSDKDILANITKYYQNGILTQDFILNNLMIFFKEKNKYATNPLYNQIISNIEELKKIKYDFTNVNYNPDILLLPKEELINNIEILKDYNLDEFNYVYLMNNISLVSCLDLMLENDIPLYLLKPIGDTKDYKLTIKKIILSRLFSFQYLTNSGMLLPSITNSNSFIIPDNSIDEHIINDVEDYQVDLLPPKKIKSDLISNLDKNYYDIQSKCYIINGIKISRNKFIRLISNNNSINISLLYNSILPEEYINEVLSLVKENTLK